MWIPTSSPEEAFYNTDYEKYQKFLTKPLRGRQEMNLPEEQLEWCQKLLRKFDYDHDGSLSRGEFKEVLLHLRLDEKVPEFKQDRSAFDTFCMKAFDAFDEDNDDLISQSDFNLAYQSLQSQYAAVMPSVRSVKEAKERKQQMSKATKIAEQAQREFELLSLDEKAMHRIFRLFDKDDSGFLDVAEIKQIVREMGIPDYERDDYTGFLSRNQRLVDADASGEIEFDEFRLLLQSLVTCKVDRNYRQYILSKPAGGSGSSTTAPAGKAKATAKAKQKLGIPKKP